MKSRFFLMAFLCCIFSNAASLYQAPMRTATISSAYLEKLTNSNEGLVEFPLSVIDGYGALFDFTTKHFNQRLGARLAIVLVEFPTISYWLANSLFVPYHEFGHARVSKALGVPYHYTSSGFGTNVGGISNFWGLSAVRLVTPPFFWPGSGIATTSYKSEKFKTNARLSKHWGKDGERIIMSAAGLNNQSFLAKEIAGKVYRGSGHITQFSHYFGNKISGWVYTRMARASGISTPSSNDIGSFTYHLNHKGIDVSYGHVEFQSLLSLLSGTTFAFFKGYYDYVAHGDARVYAQELYGVRIPDINSYVNARGLSLEFVSGYRYSTNLSFDLAYEFIWKGERAHQVTPSIHYNFAALWPKANALWGHFDLILARGVGANMGIEWMPYAQTNPSFWERFSYCANAHLYNGLSLYGERNINAISTTSVLGFIGYAGIKLNY